MKSSTKLDPGSSNAQSWTPVDFYESGTETDLKNDGKPVSLFDCISIANGGESATKKVIKSDQNVNPSQWQARDIAYQMPLRKNSNPDWQPSLKFATATAPQDISRELIHAAKKEAEQILLSAQKEAKGIQEQAYQDGWNNAMGEIKNHMDTASALVKEISDWRDNLIAQSEQMILDFVRSISQKMFGEGYELDRDTLQLTFNKVLENARSLGNLRIYVHPEDASSLGPYWREFQESITSHTIEIVPSSSIARGGCYVNGQWGSADGRIETQLKSILETIDGEAEVLEN